MIDRKGDQEQGSGSGSDGQVTSTVQDRRVHFKAGIASGSRKPGADRPRSHSLTVAVGGKARDGTFQAQDAGAKRKKPQNSSDSDSDDEASCAKFPLAKRYPFIFRMMLHKLYQLNDWAQKVKDVLERSQVEYKPLAETAVDKGGQEQGSGLGLDGQVTSTVEDGRVHFKAGTAGGSRKPEANRPRSHSLAVTVGGKSRDGTSLKSPRLSPTNSLRQRLPRRGRGQ